MHRLLHLGASVHGRLCGAPLRNMTPTLRNRFCGTTRADIRQRTRLHYVKRQTTYLVTGGAMSTGHSFEEKFAACGFCHDAPTTLVRHDADRDEDPHIQHMFSAFTITLDPRVRRLEEYSSLAGMCTTSHHCNSAIVRWASWVLRSEHACFDSYNHDPLIQNGTVIIRGVVCSDWSAIHFHFHFFGHR